MKRPGWKLRFGEPIALQDGRKLVTLRQAADYITNLPKAEHGATEWQTAIDMLMKAADFGESYLMFARIGMLQALHRHVKRVFNPDRKDHHWGKRKLKRDE